MVKLNIGDKAPDFISKNQNGEEISLKSYKGKKVVLYFYPKDDTEACTNEACNLRDNYTDLRKAGYEIIGVSADNIKSHDKFVKKYNLPFHLLADEERVIQNKYGTYGEKLFFGKIVTGIIRTTFIINEKGKIEDIITKVNTKKHTEQILK
ncbi:MAG: thioredoxin-dependent thiol peroxidase [Bacteroidetes bacterium]|nr:thioredoxin-dependent thiol peroxidase [Bacteroidota bacterium]